MGLGRARLFTLSFAGLAVQVKSGSFGALAPEGGFH